MPTKSFTMHSNIRSKSGTLILKTLSAAVASALCFSSAYAAGLGKLTVLSSLGQPLRAEIELTSVSKDEAGALVAKLASGDTFRQANIDFNAALLSLQFAVEQRGSRQFIRVSSSQPLNEPFVDMLLELNGPNGRLVREYTFLLDPADLRTSQSAQVAPAPVAVPQADATSQAVQSNRTESPVRAERPRPAARPVTTPGAAPSVPSETRNDASRSEYRVRSGDSLAKIAGQFRPSGISLDQMLVALYQANPDAFIGNNMNRLRAGQILSVPGTETARGVGAAEAQGIVLAHSADFNNYRNRLAGQVAAEAPRPASNAGQSSAGKITARVDEPATPAAASKDKLKLSEANVRQGGPGSASTEDRLANDKALADANARLRELERNVGELQKLLDIKNRDLASQQASAGKATDRSPAETPGASKPITPAPSAASAASVVPATPAMPNPPAATSAPAVPNASNEPIASAAPSGAPAASTPPIASADKPAVPAPAKPKAALAPPPPPPEPSFFEDLMDNPLVLPGVGILVLGLAALGLVSARRRKQQKAESIAPSSIKGDSLFASSAGQDDETQTSGFSTGFAHTAGHENNEVDPVAEADVYIAYGRDAQAEEILREALRTQPDRHALRLKLLEIYSNRQDRQAFEALATELYAMTKGKGEDWARAAAMGVAIDPDNPLYAGGKKAAPGAGAAEIVLGAAAAGAAASLAAESAPDAGTDFATVLSAKTADAGVPDDLPELDADDASFFSNTVPALDMPLTSTEPDLPLESQPASAESNPHEIEFDLDGLTLDSAAIAPAASVTAPAEPDDNLASIDFDFLDEQQMAAVAPAEETDIMLDPIEPPSADAKPAEATPVADLPELNIPHLDIPELQDDAETAAPHAEELNKPLDLSAQLPDLMEFDLPAIPADAGAKVVTPGLDASFADTEAPAVEAPPSAEQLAAAHDPLDFDLTGLSLELDEPAEEMEENPPAHKPDLAAQNAEFDLLGDFGSLEPHSLDSELSAATSEEMATKLDLALAYQEIGDKEGARELLDEVMKGGTPEQSEKAKSLLLELA